MSIAKIQDQTSQTGAKDTGLTQATAGFGSKVEEQNTKGHVNATSSDPTRGCDSGGAEPHNDSNNVPPQVAGRRIVLGVQELAIKANIVDRVSIQEAVAVQTVFDHITSTVARSRGAFIQLVPGAFVVIVAAASSNNQGGVVAQTEQEGKGQDGKETHAGLGIINNEW
jgi:hypothetical protein